MTLQDLGSIGEFLGALAVVVSLFYVASQIRQNTSAVKSATAQAVHDNYATWYTSISRDPELAQLLISGLRDYKALSEVEKARFIASIMVFLSYSQNAFYKWHDGSLTADLWIGWEALMLNLFGSPGGRDFWAERSYVFGEEFRNHVEQVIMKKSPNPAARPFGAFEIH